MKYNSHGSFEIKSFNDVILIRLIGGTNIELFYKLQEKLFAAQDNLKSEKWILVTDFTFWELAPPDFFKAAAEHSENNEDTRTKPNDHIIIDPTMMMESVFRSMGFKNTDNSTNFHNVPNITSAENLLKQLGYCGSILS